MIGIKHLSHIKKRTKRPTDEAHAANAASNRVCLVLLRIYRKGNASTEDLDQTEAMRSFWPIIREEKPLLRHAIGSMHRLTVKQGRRRSHVVEIESEEDFPDCLRQLLDPGVVLPETQPEIDVLQALATGLFTDAPAFRPLFDAVEQKLEDKVTNHKVASDRNIEILSGLLGLTDVERSLLTLCFAIELSTLGSSPFSCFSRQARQFEALQTGLNLPNDQGLRLALSTKGNLYRSGLMVAEGHRNQDLEDILRLTRQGSALIGTSLNSIEEMASIVLKPLAPSQAAIPLSWPHLEERGSLLQAVLSNALEHRKHGINLLFYGAPGTGKTEYAADLVKRVGAEGYAICDEDDESGSASRSERLANLGLSQRFAPDGSSILVLDEAEDIFQGDYNSPMARLFGKQEGGKSWMNNVLEGNPKPVIWISNHVGHIDPAHLRRFTYCLEFPTTPRGVRRAIAHAYLDKVGCSPDLVELVASHAHVAPGLLASAANFAEMAGASGPASDKAVRNLLVDNLKAMGKELPAKVPERATRFDMQYLNVKGQISPDAVLDGLQRLGRGTLLLSGPPGTGKTQLAAEIALRMGRELIYKTASDINTMWFGESERNVARMFTECDAASEVLFLDEADTLLGSREASGHRADIAVSAEFLRRIETFDGVFVCSTNHATVLDPALMRRFNFRLGFLPLSFAQRHQMLCETALGWDPGSALPIPDLDPTVAAHLGRLDQLTPGDFANVVKRVRTLQLSLDLPQWLDELQAEQDVKPNAVQTAIGFV